MRSGVFPINKQTKQPWYISTAKRLSKYQDYQRRAIFLREELARSTTSGQVTDLDGKAVDKQEELRQAENEIYLIDKAISLLSGLNQFIVREKYAQGNKDKYVHSLSTKAFPALKIQSRDSYYRLKDEAVEELAGTFGYIEKEVE